MCIVLKTLENTGHNSMLEYCMQITIGLTTAIHSYPKKFGISCRYMFYFSCPPIPLNFWPWLIYSISENTKIVTKYSIENTFVEKGYKIAVFTKNRKNQ